jgi:hypothetical protein|tara:strand:+ start:1339 stop:1479 length:141 start_codon:yes stop_codon:yes gene_type:complete
MKYIEFFLSIIGVSLLALSLSLLGYYLVIIFGHFFLNLLNTVGGIS